MSAFISTSLALRTPRTRRETPRCAVDTEAPPQSRYAKYYPVPCFEAPYINLFNAPDVPLVNKLALVREEVPLDLDSAAALLAQARAAYATSEHDPSHIFTGPTKDNMATDPSDRYYPQFRRNEAPIIDITPPKGEDPDEGTVTITLGTILPTPPPESTTPKLPASDHQSFWNLPVSPAATPTVDLYFGKARRNLAPVITFPPGQLGVSVSMQTITGECPAEHYPAETRFQAPNITIRKPLGEWDETAFVSVEMEEVQLPLIEAATLNVAQ